MKILRLILSLFVFSLFQYSAVFAQCPLPSDVEADAAIICTGESSSVSGIVASGAIEWYSAATDGSLIETTNSGVGFTVSPTVTTSYYAQRVPVSSVQTFNYTGAVQTFTVPSGVTSITVDAKGARGGNSAENPGYGALPGGDGGRVQTTMTVTAGEVLYIYVGGRGYGGCYCFPNSPPAPGWNGGGAGTEENAGTGGGATDIRIGGQTLNDRVVVAGGGGGAVSGGCWSAPSEFGGGGDGGGLAGGTGEAMECYSATALAQGGTQVAGGLASCSAPTSCASAGTLGQGGNAREYGGSGGGGWYGGGGGYHFHAGGGGSSYTDATRCSSVTHEQGSNNTNGSITFSYTAGCQAASRVAAEVQVPATVNWYLDADNDGYYIAGPVSDCQSPGVGYNTTASVSGDCDDTNSAVNAGQIEVGNNGWDDDCNGTVDVTGDNVCDAILLTVDQLSGVYTNVGATVEVGEPGPSNTSCTTQNSWCPSQAINQTIWFKFVAPYNSISISFSPADWDSQIALWRAPDCAGMTNGDAVFVAANDNTTGASPFHAAITEICLTPGATYYIQVDGYRATTNSTISLLVTDEGGTTWYADTDNDSYGDLAATFISCAVPSGYVADNTDCDDDNTNTHETFDFYVDADTDGYGTGSLLNGICAVDASTPPTGYSLNNTDCDDGNTNAHETFDFYLDSDQDGYGTGNLVSGICAANSSTPPTGYSTNNTDCDDGNSNGYQMNDFYVDSDLDGHGTGNLVNICSASAGSPPSGYSLNNTDCDVNNSNIYQLNDFYVDSDLDGYGTGSLVSICSTTAGSPPSGYSTNDNDCDDTNGAIRPGVLEIGNNGIDENCDGSDIVPGDNVCDAVLVTVGSYVSNGVYSNAGASVQSGEPTPPNGSCTGQASWCSVPNQTLWFKFVAPVSSVSISTVPDNWDGQLALWSAPHCDSLLTGAATMIAANDDGPNMGGTGGAWLSPGCLQSGETYYIQADGRNNTTNSFRITVKDELYWPFYPDCPGTWDGSASTDWNNASNWSADQVPSSGTDVTIPSAPSNQPHITLGSVSPAVCANMTVQSGATLTINEGKALTISGNLKNEGSVIVKADATGIGSLITEGRISGAGSFQMEQYLTGSGGNTPNGLFYYVSNPTVGATAAVYDIASGNKLWSANETTQNYSLIASSTVLNTTQGYVARMGSTGTITLSGTSFNTGDISTTGLTRTGSTEVNRGYNLVGNPYPSTVNWDDATKTNLETSMYYRTHQGSTMLYDTYNTIGSIGTNNNLAGAVTGIIPPTQSFWVRVDADGNAGQLDFTNAMRSHGTLSSIYRMASEEGTVRLTLSNEFVSDETILFFNSEAQDTYDDFDSQKFWAAASVPQLYTTIGPDTLVINGLYSAETNPVVDLGMKLPVAGNYTLNANQITVTGESVYLEDRMLNVFQDLNAEPTYSFTSGTGNIPSRFALHFGMSVTGIEDGFVTNARVYSTSGNQLNIILSDNIERGNVSVLDMAGRTITTFKINSNTTSTKINVNTGVYLIRIETEKGIDTHRIVLQ